MGFIITTTGTLSPVILNDLGWEVSHPTVSLDIQQPNGSFSLEDIQSSTSLQNAIDSGYITVVDEDGESVTVVSGYDISHNKVTLLGTSDYITIDPGQKITRNKLDISDDTNLIGGTGVSLSGSNTLYVSGLEVTEFASTNISQWTNDVGYITYANFIEAKGSITTTDTGGWVIRTLSNVIDGVAQIVIDNNHISSSRVVGVRAAGSVISRTISIAKNTSVTMNVRTDSSGNFEIFSDGSSIAFWDFGHFE